MTFCRFSPGYKAQNKTIIDNVFIDEFLPKAPDLCVKVYLMGLSKCDSDDNENSLQFFSETFNVCEEDIVSIFKYWEDMGLIQVLNTNPIEVRYLKINSTAGDIKKFKVDKYSSFNIQAQELLNKRMIMPNEFADFYYLIEKKHMTEDAVLEIIRYCAGNKGANVSPNYCITVAKDWVREGVYTLEDVNRKTSELGVVDDKMNIILSSMGSRRAVQIEDKELLYKWLNDMDFDLNVIVYVAKMLRVKKHRVDINVLDQELRKYFELKLMSVGEIENYENEKEQLRGIAKAVNKELGIFYEDLSKEIDTYIINWLNMGFDEEILRLVADNCFKSSIKSLEGLNGILNKLFKLGVVSKAAYLEYLNDNLSKDNKIKEVLNHLNLNRNVNNMDRNFYSTWTISWGFGHDVILYAADLSSNKANAWQYLNRILSNWNTSGLKTLDQVKDMKPTDDQEVFIHNNYTKEQISSLITNLDEVEV